MSAPTYEIRTVLDFLKVPKDRRPLCLHEFAMFLEMVEPSCELLGLVADETISKGAVRFGPIDLFKWVDDERGAAAMSVRMPDGSSQEVFDITPEDARDISDALDAIDRSADAR